MTSNRGSLFRAMEHQVRRMRTQINDLKEENKILKIKIDDANKIAEMERDRALRYQQAMFFPPSDESSESD